MWVIGDIWERSNGDEIQSCVSYAEKDICDLCTIMERVRYFNVPKENIPAQDSRLYMEKLFGGINEEIMINILSELDVFYFCFLLPFGGGDRMGTIDYLGGIFGQKFTI